MHVWIFIGSPVPCRLNRLFALGCCTASQGTGPRDARPLAKREDCEDREDREDREDGDVY